MINEVKLNPVTLNPNTIFARNPPTTAPKIPKTIEPSKPPDAGAGSTILAMVPAISPKTIQAKIFINFSPPLKFLTVDIIFIGDKSETTNW